jgi:hypothetical protein
MMVCLDIAGPAASGSAQQLVTTSSPERAHRAAVFFPAFAPPCGGPVLRNTPTPREVNPTKLPTPWPHLFAHTLKTDALRADDTTFVRNLSWV